MNSVLLSITTDDTTKRELKDFAAEIGVTSAGLVNMLIKQALRERKIVLSTQIEPTPQLENLIREADAEYKAGHTTRFDNAHEAVEYLDALSHS
jgi:antitoxin component of RelBE/YafQ-DinJ toxin-antitoxin module